MKSITALELKAKLDSNELLQLIDIREEHEIMISSLDGEHIPMAEILHVSEKINKEGMVVIHCRSGKRSAAVIHALESKYSFDNLYNLEGGILAWAQQVDPKMEQY
jgi:rhodanese-related sulfurtransferase